MNIIPTFPASVFLALATTNLATTGCQTLRGSYWLYYSDFRVKVCFFIALASEAYRETRFSLRQLSQLQYAIFFATALLLCEGKTEGDAYHFLLDLHMEKLSLWPVL